MRGERTRTSTTPLRNSLVRRRRELMAGLADRYRGALDQGSLLAGAARRLTGPLEKATRIPRSTAALRLAVASTADRVLTRRRLRDHQGAAVLRRAAIGAETVSLVVAGWRAHRATGIRLVGDDGPHDLDSILVIDGASDDATVRVAAALPASVLDDRPRRVCLRDEAGSVVDVVAPYRLRVGASPSSDAGGSARLDVDDRGVMTLTGRVPATAVPFDIDLGIASALVRWRDDSERPELQLARAAGDTAPLVIPAHSTADGDHQAHVDLHELARHADADWQVSVRSGTGWALLQRPRDRFPVLTSRSEAPCTLVSRPGNADPRVELKYDRAGVVTFRVGSP